MKESNPLGDSAVDKVNVLALRKGVADYHTEIFMSLSLLNDGTI